MNDSLPGPVCPPRSQATVVRAPCDGCGHLGAVREQNEAPGPVGHLRHSGLEARLSEQCRVLITGDSRHRHPGQ